jgi:hypothetical protein
MTGADFTTRLRLELRAAAEREEHRARFADAVTLLRPRLRPGALAAAAAAATAVALVVVLLAAAPAGLRPDAAAPGTGLRVLTNVALADGLGRSSQVAFGSVWVNATNDGAVLRIDPRTRRVTARIRVGTDVNLGAGGGAIWAMPRRPGVTTTPLLRIDPRTNRVVARIPINSPGARFPFGGASIVGGPRVWVVSSLGLVAVDPTRNRPVRAIVLGGGFQVRDALVRGNELWVSRADRSITRFDVVTGRRLGRLPWTGPDGFVVPYGERIVKVGRRSVSLADAHGRPLWRTRLGTQLNQAGVAAGRLLVEGVNGSAARDTLWELDPRTGRILDALTVPGFSVNALLTVGREAWLITADGHAIVVAP